VEVSKTDVPKTVTPEKVVPKRWCRKNRVSGENRAKKVMREKVEVDRKRNWRGEKET